MARACEDLGIRFKCPVPETEVLVAQNFISIHTHSPFLKALKRRPNQFVLCKSYVSTASKIIANIFGFSFRGALAVAFVSTCPL